VAVAGLPQTRAAIARPRPLVVLPTLTWQGANPVDDDMDGFVDTLQSPGRVRLDRPFANGRLPGRFTAQTLPLLAFLERARLAYDLTTDVALAAGEGPALGNAPGVAFAGSARWLSYELGRRLRLYVEDGGRVASFGVDAFRRPARVGRLRATTMGGPRPANVFGERTRDLLQTSGAPLVVERDDLHLFSAADRFVGEFTLFERSAGLPQGVDPITAAGRDPGEPAFVAYRLGHGIVIRSGTPQWGAELAPGRLGVEVPRATRRIWRLLARGRGSS
jgi:hypothetical protein